MISLLSFTFPVALLLKEGYMHVERPSQYAIMLSFSIVSSLLNEFQYSYQIYVSVADLPQSIDINNVLYFPIQEQ